MVRELLWSGIHRHRLAHSGNGHVAKGTLLGAARTLHRDLVASWGANKVLNGGLLGSRDLAGGGLNMEGQGGYHRGRKRWALWLLHLGCSLAMASTGLRVGGSGTTWV